MASRLMPQLMAWVASVWRSWLGELGVGHPSSARLTTAGKCTTGSASASMDLPRTVHRAVQGFISGSRLGGA